MDDLSVFARIMVECMIVHVFVLEIAVLHGHKGKTFKNIKTL